MKKLRVSVIGLGRIASLLEKDKLRAKPCTHAGGISKVKELKITSCCDIDKDRLQEFAKTWNVKNCYTDYKELIQNEKIDILVVATWSHTHKDIVLESLKNSSIKAIVCEKPLGINVKEAEEIVNACKKRKVHLLVNHERRYERKYQAVKKALENGVIGEIKTVIGNVLTGIFGKVSKKKYGGGPMLHDGTHLIDILRYLIGEIDFAKGHIKKGKSVENIAVAYIHFENGVNCFIEAGGERKYFNFELDIQGTKGRLRVGNGIAELYLKKESTLYEKFYDIKPVEFVKYTVDKQGMQLLYENVRDLVLGKTKNNISSGYDGLQAVKIIYKIYKNELMRKRKK